MKLGALVRQILMEKSAAAKEAEGMGLQYYGYGRWKDKNGRLAAKTINGVLTKVEDSDAPEGTMAAQQGAEPVATSRTLSIVPDAPDTDFDEPESTEVEPVRPMSVISRLLAAANGDAMKVRKALVKKVQSGDSKGNELLAQLDAHEQAEHDHIKQSLAAVQARKNAAHAERKAKYNQLYPSPQI